MKSNRFYFLAGGLKIRYNMLWGNIVAHQGCVRINKVSVRLLRIAFTISLIICLTGTTGAFKDLGETVSSSVPGLSVETGRISDLQPCDILVKPNHNWIPGTTWATGGESFGHAAIVIDGAADSSVNRLLRKVLLFESHARDVPEPYQIRSVHGIVPGDDFRFSNDSWGENQEGFRYRLRMDLKPDQKEAIISYLLSKDNHKSSWRATKDYLCQSPRISAESDSSHCTGDNWYCSLLIWQAFYSVMGIDLDANAGLYVYPNDLINSPFFGAPRGSRIRF